jgi:crotonobetainyl-CoA:carnitine CoA-transferase CaiB-like acyl-CoA transferase
MLIIEDHQFEALCRVLNREDLIADERFQGLMQRIVYSADLFRMLEEELTRWPTAELVARARRLGAPLAPVNGIPEFLSDQQVMANRTVFEVDDPTAGRMRFLGNPVRFQETSPSFRRYPPRLGEHTEEVLREAGYSDAEVQELRALAAIA